MSLKGLSIGDLAAAASTSMASFAWVAELNAILQLGATATAIIAGIYAIKWHRARLRELKRNQDEQSNRRPAGPTPRDTSPGTTGTIGDLHEE